MDDQEQLERIAALRDVWQLAEDAYHQAASEYFVIADATVPLPEGDVEGFPLPRKVFDDMAAVRLHGMRTVEQTALAAWYDAIRELGQ